MSETYLDPCVPLHHVNLEIQGYKLFRSDHPSQQKRGGVCICFRNSLPLKILNIHYLRESVSFELQVGSKICKIVSLYWSPSQRSDNFEKFADNFELTIDTLVESNSDLVAVLGNSNIKSKNWYINDKPTTESAEIEFVTSQFGLLQIKNEPTYVLENSSSCIDLIFTSQPNLVVDSGVHPSLHPNWHHQTVYTKFNLKIRFLSLRTKNIALRTRKHWTYKNSISWI